VKVPNHTLFVERIYNLTETAGAVHEFLIAFNMFGRDNTNMVSYGMRAGEMVSTRALQLCGVLSLLQDKINSFFQRLKHFTLRESKEWKVHPSVLCAFDWVTCLC
jgi:hypothetical protein